MAFGIAVSGLRAATADLDVTGNNIANSNTTGFKSARAQFADVFAVSDLGIPRNAIGQGVRLAAVSQQFTQGHVSFTDSSLDLAINGSGFFVLDDNGARTYSRAGASGVDNAGQITNPTGQRLLGFQPSAGSITGAIGPLQLTTQNIPPRASTAVQLGLNLDAGATPPTAAFSPADPFSFNSSTSLTVFDSLGEQHLAQVYLRKADSNEWQSFLRINDDATQTLGAQTLQFDTAGQLTSAMPVSFGDYTPPTGAAPLSLNFDFTSTTQFGAPFGVNALSQDGFTTGRIAGVDIDADGLVLARFTNGQSLPQGQVALASFSNPQGLAPLSDSLWGETSSSGVALVGAPGSASLGLVQSGALEDSNVDLSEQLVRMIVAQRNFQANAQMIRAEDEITQTIINIR